MTSLAARLGSGAPTLAGAREAVAVHLARQMSYTGCAWAAPDETRRLAAADLDETIAAAR